MRLLILGSLLTLVLTGCGNGDPNAIHLLNVSYDPTRELWKGLNETFADAYKKETGKTVEIRQSHGGSASQARSIIDGLQADVATLSLFPDTDALRKNGLLKADWLEALPNRSLPYTSTLVFVVRAGNPKRIHDWKDLVDPSVSIITPNPKTSGNGRISFMAAWASIVLNGGSEDEAVEFVRKLYANVPVLDAGARAATMTFSAKNLGDVHLTMENEALSEVKLHPDEFQIVYPSISFLHEPHLTVVDKIVDQRQTRSVAEAYLKFLYTPDAQEIIAQNYFRPTDEGVLARHKDVFKDVKLFRVTDIAKDWDEVQQRFFADGGLFESIYRPKSGS
ncbi:MAG TPA: sulfate ABC transporter substrate-binding protein [Caulifigura sp.]|nr:sulfate ABC transporter substrate-binding protein [Caulifigura sp.]